MIYTRQRAGKSVLLSILLDQLSNQAQAITVLDYPDVNYPKHGQCIGCIYKNNSSAHVLICAVHPSGPGQEGCPDFQGE